MITINKPFSFADFVTYSQTFIETGTSDGAGVQEALKAGFKRIRSVELSPQYYKKCKTRFAGNKKVQLFYGNSTDILPLMLDGIKGTAVIWLDAHPSGPGSAGHSDLMEKGDFSEFNQHNILKKELKIILSRGLHVILIDDQQGLNSLTKQYMDICNSYNPNYRFQFYDQQIDGIFYKHKILVCVP